MSKTTSKFSPEVRERAVRMVSEHRADHRSEWDTLVSIAGKIGCTAETLRRWCRDESGRHAGPAALAGDDRARLKLLEREVKELRRANEILRKASAYFAMAELDRQVPMTMAFIDAHRAELGIEPICRELAVAPSSYHQHAARLTDPGKRSARARRDDDLKSHIRGVHEASFGLYGSRKVWRQLLWENVTIAKCTVERLMKVMGLAGARRGKSCVTTVRDRKAACPLDKVNREFKVKRPMRFGSSTSLTSTPGRGSSTWPSSSTRSPAGSSAGKSAAARPPASCWMRWSRQSMPGDPPPAMASSIIRTGARNTSP